jgi:hypothetical protein
MNEEYQANRQPTKELKYFQKLIVARHYIEYLKRACDNLDWENEKKDALIEMKDEEIREAKKATGSMQQERDRARYELREFIGKRKKNKIDSEKLENQRLKIIELQKELDSTKERLRVRDRMIEIYNKQRK